VIFGSATILSLLAKLDDVITACAAAVVTIFSVIDLVVGTSKMAQVHHDLSRRFMKLEKEMAGSMAENEDDYRKFIAARLSIEEDEPPVMRCLDTLCHNELLFAYGYDPIKDADQYRTLNRRQRFFAQIMDIGMDKSCQPAKISVSQP
jgi:hypothetical protein